jgi:hypothetical protein
LDIMIELVDYLLLILVLHRFKMLAHTHRQSVSQYLVRTSPGKCAKECGSKCK